MSASPKESSAYDEDTRPHASRNTSTSTVKATPFKVTASWDPVEVVYAVVFSRKKPEYQWSLPNNHLCVSTFF